MKPIYIATEDILSEAVVDRLVLEVNQGLHVAVRVGRKGNSYLRKEFPALRNTAIHIPVFLLTDLDRVKCAPTLIDRWRGTQSVPENMLFRVAVREIEAWLLADREGFSRFSGIPKEKIPFDPETIEDPKNMLLNLVRRHSPRKLKELLLPSAGSTAAIGFYYNATLCDFVRSSAWSVQRAANRAESLQRTCGRLRELSLRMLRAQ